MGFDRGQTNLLCKVLRETNLLCEVLGLVLNNTSGNFLLFNKNDKCFALFNYKNIVVIQLAVADGPDRWYKFTEDMEATQRTQENNKGTKNKRKSNVARTLRALPSCQRSRFVSNKQHNSPCLLVITV